MKKDKNSVLVTGAASTGQRRGRPSSYQAEYSDQAEKLCLLGATDQDLADFFGVNECTINLWKKKHPEFSVSIKKGKLIADARVAQKLFERATGYVHDDVHISNYKGDITITKIQKHYAPDTTAAIFWLKNRQRDKWRDRQEHDVTVHRSIEDLVCGDDEA